MFEVGIFDRQRTFGTSKLTFSGATGAWTTCRSAPQGLLVAVAVRRRRQRIQRIARAACVSFFLLSFTSHLQLYKPIKATATMAPTQHLKLLLTLGLLAARSLAAPGGFPQKPMPGDDDDTPLPLVVWHGT